MSRFPIYGRKFPINISIKLSVTGDCVSVSDDLNQILIAFVTPLCA